MDVCCSANMENMRRTVGFAGVRRPVLIHVLAKPARNVGREFLNMGDGKRNVRGEDSVNMGDEEPHAVSAKEAKYVFTIAEKLSAKNAKAQASANTIVSDQNAANARARLSAFINV